jgi:hypothetical protein
MLLEEEKQKIQEAYESILLNEANEEVQFGKALEKLFGVKIKSINVKKNIQIKFKGQIDQEEMENFSKIDAFEDFVNKKLKNAIIDWGNYNSINIKEL